MDFIHHAQGRVIELPFTIDPILATAVTIFSIAGIVAGMLLAPWFVSKLPEDVFFPGHRTTHPARKILRNIVGFHLLLIGLLLLVLPGQGLLTILAALALMDFPYKKALLRRIASRPRICRTLNRWRVHHGVPPFAFPARSEES